MGGSLVQGLVKLTCRHVSADRLRRSWSVSDGMPFTSVISNLRNLCMATASVPQSMQPSSQPGIAAFSLITSRWKPKTTIDNYRTITASLQGQEHIYGHTWRAVSLVVAPGASNAT